MFAERQALLSKPKLDITANAPNSKNKKAENMQKRQRIA